jgi:hypothetical protein
LADEDDVDEAEEEGSEDDELRPLFDHDDVLPRESVMYQPLPLKTMPTG